MEREYKFLVDYFMFDTETIEGMYHLRYNGMPVSFLLLDYRKTDTYCHYCSKFLNLVVPGSVRMRGKKVVLNGGEHSWLEVGDKVYDTTLVGIWKKDSYYERDVPYDVAESSLDESRKSVSAELQEEGCPELYVAWIRDLEADSENNPYSSYLTEHIRRFREEKKLDGMELDEALVSECQNELKTWYEDTAMFKKTSGNGGASSK